MAISHVQPLHLLLASLFFLPTLRATEIYDCGFGALPVVANNVEVFQKKGGASFNISCSTSRVIRSGEVTLEFKSGHVSKFKRIYDICKFVACPLLPSAFELPIDTIFSVEVEDHYDVYVSIQSFFETIMCLTFTLESARTLLSQVTG